MPKERKYKERIDFKWLTNGSLAQCFVGQATLEARIMLIE